MKGGGEIQTTIEALAQRDEARRLARAATEWIDDLLDIDGDEMECLREWRRRYVWLTDFQEDRADDNR